MTRIGLIGARGGVGGAALRYLLAAGQGQVFAAGRDSARMPVVFAGQEDRVAPRKLDLFDDAELAGFCREMDVVLNCAGPSSKVLDRVVLAAAAAKRPVIDAGGYDPVFRRLKEQDGPIRAAGVPVVINAGLLPGLSGLYPRWLASQESDTPEAMEVFYAGTDRWTLISAEDIVFSLGDFGAERPPTRIEGGRPVPVPFRKAFRRLDLRPPVGKVTGFLTYTEELATLGRELGIPQIDCHGVNHGFWSGAALSLIKLCKLYRTDAQLRRSARWLARASERDRRWGTRPCFAIHCRLRWADGRSRTAEIVVADTYEATGIIAGIATMMALENRILPPRVGMLHQVVDPGAFIAAFRANAPILSETVPTEAKNDAAPAGVAHA